MREIKFLTLEEREMIECGIKNGLTFPQIGRLVNRSKYSIASEVRKFGPRENYKGIKAHNHFLTAALRRRKTMKKWKDKNASPKMTESQIKAKQRKLSDRITILEQKLELLTQIIKGKQNADLLN